MELFLKRDAARPTVTLGKIYVDGAYVCESLEDRLRPLGEKVMGKTAIPAGRYEVIINRSVRFKRLLPLLLNVPGFAGVRIHSGNTQFDTEGCPLTGTARSGDTVTGSRAAFRKLYALMLAAQKRGEQMHITIQNPEAVA